MKFLCSHVVLIEERVFSMTSPTFEASTPKDQKPRLLLMGLRRYVPTRFNSLATRHNGISHARSLFVFRSGKSSIQKVVFHKMSPNETLFLESTSKVQKDDVCHSSFVEFQVWDFPGQIDFFDPAFDSDLIFGGAGALVFVIDAQVRKGLTKQERLRC
jgi:hypothetical protein